MSRQKAVTLQTKTLLCKHLIPAALKPDAAGIFEKPLAFLDPRQTLEFSVEGMIGRDKKLFAMKDGPVAALPEIPGFHAECLQVNIQGFDKRRVRTALKFRVAQIGNFWLAAVELDDVCPFHPPKIRTGAAFIEAQYGRKLRQRRLMNIKRRRGEFPDTGILAGLIDCARLS